MARLFRGTRGRRNPLISYLELADWRRQVADLFVELRRRKPDAATLAWFRMAKDALFRDHPQSPLPPDARTTFTRLPYWPFASAARVDARFVPSLESGPDLLTPEGTRLTRIGSLEFGYHGQQCRLSLLWMQGYGGGLFLPFRDATSGVDTYGGGRYLLDTIKSADLGGNIPAGTVTLDFNYAYHPSCFYDPRWVCPLAPPENRLVVAVRAGERIDG